MLFFFYHKTKLGVEDGGNTDLITLQERLKFLKMNGLQKAKVHLLKTWKKSMLRQERLKQPSAWYGWAVAKYGDKEGTRHCQTSGYFFCPAKTVYEQNVKWFMDCLTLPGSLR